MKPLLAILLSLVSAQAAAPINFKNIASTNVVKTNDLLLIDSDLGSGLYATRTIALQQALDKVNAAQVTALQTNVASANPTATIANTANNGSAATFMRSDASPALPVNLQHYNGTDTNALLSAIGGAPLASPALTNTPTINGITFTNAATNDLQINWDLPVGQAATYGIRHFPSYITDGGGDYIDDIFQVGLNPQQTANETKWYLQFESRYRVNGTSPFKSEFHLNYRSTNGLTTAQPFGLECVQTNAAITGFLAGTWALKNSVGTITHITKTEAGQLAFQGGSQVISFATNNSPVLVMLDTAGNGRNLPYVDASTNYYFSLPILSAGNEQAFATTDIRLDNTRAIKWKGNTGTTRTILSMSGTAVNLDNPEGNLLEKLGYFVTPSGSWAAQGGNYSANHSAVGNLGSSATNLMSYTFPANAIPANDNALASAGFGTFAANGNNKQVQVYLNTTLLYDTGTVTNSGGAWRFESEIVRTGTSSQLCNTKFFTATTAGCQSVAGTATMTAATNVFKVVATGTADNDIVQTFMRNGLVGGQ